MRNLDYVSFLTDRADFVERINDFEFAQFTKVGNPLEYDEHNQLMTKYRAVVSKITGMPLGPIDRGKAQFLPDNHRVRVSYGIDSRGFVH